MIWTGILLLVNMGCLTLGIYFAATQPMDFWTALILGTNLPLAINSAVKMAILETK